MLCLQYLLSYCLPSLDESFEKLNVYSNNNSINDVFFALSHGVHRGVLKKGKFDGRESFINKLINITPNVKFDLYGINNIQPIWADSFYKVIEKSKMGLNLSQGKPIKYYSSDRITQLVGNGLLTFVDEKTQFGDFFNKDELIFYNSISELSEKIIKYNSISILRNQEAIAAVKDEIETIIFCDTANTKLVPFYPFISECILSKKPKVIEIDHHFGADSEELTEYGIKLFRNANANTEIIGTILKALHDENPEGPNPFSQRNIILGLITGMLGDTVGGKAIHYKEDYVYWMEKLEEQLKEITRWRGADDKRGELGLELLARGLD